MRETVYICDQCKKILSNSKISKDHLSINFNRWSGWVTKENLWCWLSTLTGIRQFCDEKCLAAYFKGLK